MEVILCVNNFLPWFMLSNSKLCNWECFKFGILQRSRSRVCF